MLVKCEKCGYENFPQHRYCGMCAAPLRVLGVSAASPLPAQPSLPPVQHAAPKYEERPAPPPKEAPSRQVSGPSFLGLGQEPAEDKNRAGDDSGTPAPRLSDTPPLDELLARLPVRAPAAGVGDGAFPVASAAGSDGRAAISPANGVSSAAPAASPLAGVPRLTAFSPPGGMSKKIVILTDAAAPMEAKLRKGLRQGRAGPP